jgi:tetratricopeptide (TPR) repeat protein
MKRHLLPGEIIEAATRQLATSEAIEHLSVCPQCKRKIEEYRATRMAVVPAGATQNSPPGPDCPPLEKLAAWSAGEKDPQLAGHIAICDRCAWIVRDALESDTEPAPRTTKSRLRNLRRAFWYAVALLVIGSTGFWIFNMLSAQRASRPSVAAAASDASQDLADLLAKAYTETRPFEYLLNNMGYSAVHPTAASDHSGYVAAAIVAIDRRLTANAGDAEASAYEARVDLLLGKYQDAIGILTRVSGDWPDNPAPVRDLATAYALRGIREDRAADYETAARLFRQVLDKHPNNGPALFNLALTEEHLFHAGEAADYWKRYIALSPGSGWEQEANRHLAMLEKIRQ